MKMYANAWIFRKMYHFLHHFLIALFSKIFSWLIPKEKPQAFVSKKMYFFPHTATISIPSSLRPSVRCELLFPACETTFKTQPKREYYGIKSDLMISRVVKIKWHNVRINEKINSVIICVSGRTFGGNRRAKGTVYRSFGCVFIYKQKKDAFEGFYASRRITYFSSAVVLSSSLRPSKY